ncbi:MAG: peptidoglycan-binding protein [Clostridiales bacterium]|nr:peptidoglycan-binding protein [Clostridiales bacterium]
MQRVKKITAIILCILTLSSVCVFGSVSQAGASGTGAGLAEWALNAYYSGWSYVYGGSSAGAVDCSGLIYSYCGGARTSDALLSSATASGSASSIPRIHGLGLWSPGHVGVYIGDGMEVDARNESSDMCYQSVSSSYMGWTYWFKVAACTYVTNGWEEFNGGYYYYEDGQYIVSTSRTIDGVTYTFDSTGKADRTPSDTSSSSSSSSSTESSGSSDTSSSSSSSSDTETGTTSSVSSSSNVSSNSEQTIWQYGSSGEEVTKIQERLTELGYYTGDIDGQFGYATQAAYMAFQEAAGLTVDGIAGSDREILYSDDAPAAAAEEVTEEEETEEATEAAEEETTEAEEEEETVEEDVNEWKSGDENDTVKAIQDRLAELGYFDIESTGYFGDYTVQAVKNFQLANNFASTGIVDEETYNWLFSDEAIENPYLTTDEEDSSGASESGPVQMPVSTDISQYIITNEQNQGYADTASKVVTTTNRVTKKALSNSSSVISAATTSEVKRTANIWLWFVLVAVILTALAVVFFLRDRKANRYARYLARKEKRLAQASADTDITVRR